MSYPTVPIFESLGPPSLLQLRMRVIRPATFMRSWRVTHRTHRLRLVTRSILMPYMSAQSVLKWADPKLMHFHDCQRTHPAPLRVSSSFTMPHLGILPHTPEAPDTAFHICSSHYTLQLLFPRFLRCLVSKTFDRVGLRKLRPPQEPATGQRQMRCVHV